MANEITLRVTTNEAEALMSLGRIDEAASAIAKEPYKLTFDVKGLEDATKTMVSLANAQARIKKSEADIVKARQATQQVWAVTSAAIQQSEELTKQMTEATKTAIQKTAQEEAKLNRERERAAQQSDKTAQAEARLATQQEKTRTEAERTAQVQAKLATQEEKTRTETERTNRALINQEGALQKTNSAANTFIGTLGALAASKALSTVKRQFREALDTMREVDQELANIQKVSDYSAEEIARIGEEAYQTASRYGVAAEEYLSSTAQWAKAGYDNATQLAELSTKLQLVGDVNSEVASQFLLSADAAWKFGGNITQLSKVIDEANVIENNYATSIEKISEGLPIVASTAAMAGMSMEQTMAAIGTITARTQESGRKAATALRSLILNITKQVGAEIEDGVNVTEESVKSLYDLLEKYAPAALEAAEATGQIVNPMEAIASLAKAARDGLMTEQEMFNLLNSLGGKLRVNQLMTLVNGFETYEEMLERVENAAGSADKEVEVMLNTWNAKTNILKNTFAEFVSKTISSDFVKALLDGATALLQFADNAGSVALVVGGLITIFKGKQIVDGFTASMKALQLVLTGVASTATVVSLGLGLLIAGIGVATQVEAAVHRARQEQMEAGKEAAIHSQEVAGLYANYLALSEEVENGADKEDELRAAAEKLNTTLGAQGLAADKLKDSYAELKESLAEATEGELNLALAQARMGQTAAERELRKFYGQFSDAVPFNQDTYGVQYGTPDWLKTAQRLGSEKLGSLAPNTEDYYRLTELLTELQPKLKEYEDSAAAVAEIEEILAAARGEDADALEKYTDALDASSEAQEKNAESVDAVKDALDGAREAKDAFDAAMKAEEKDDIFQSYAKAFKTLQEEIDAGRVNSNAFWASAEFLFGPEVLETMGRDAAEIAAHAAEIAPLFEDADSAGRGLLSVMEEVADENGRILDASGRVIATIHAGADGGWSWLIEDADALAEKLGVDADAIVALQSAMGVYSEVSVAESKKAEEAHDKVAEAAGGATGALQEMADTSTGQLVEQIDNVTGALGEAEAAARRTGAAIAGMDSVSSGYMSGGRAAAGRAAVGPRAYAAGSRNAAAGDALVNERGPELISDGGRAFIAGGGAPTIVNLSQGATVFTAEQTRSILGSGRVYNGMPAFEVGRNSHFANHLGGAIWGMNFTPGSVDGLSGGAGGSGGGGAGGSAGMEEAQKILDALLKNLDLQAKLAKNEGNIPEMNRLYQQAQDEIQKVVDQYLAEGYEETSNEVLTLKNLIYSYADKMEDLAGNAFKEVEKGLSDVLKGLDERAKLAQNEGDYARMNELYQEAQDEIRKVIDQYLEAGYAEDSQQIAALQNKIYSYAGKMEDLRALRFKETEKILDGVLKNLNAQAELAQNEGDYARMNELYQEAQDEIQKVVDQYLAAGYEATSDEVLTLRNQLFDYADKMKDLAALYWQELEGTLDKALDTIDSELSLAQYQGNSGRMMELYREAQSEIEKLLNQYLEAGYAANSPEVMALANRGYQYAEKQTGLADSLWKELVSAIDGLKDATEDANVLAEKQLAVDEARAAYENAQRQRTVRIFNPQTGQWEWVADQSQVSAAAKSLKSAETSLQETREAQALAELKKGGVSMSELLSSAPLSARFDSAGAEAQAAFLSALGGYFGAVDKTATGAGTSAFSTSDSHDTNTHYNIGGVSVTAQQAASMTLKDLADMLQYADIA